MEENTYLLKPSISPRLSRKQKFPKSATFFLMYSLNT